MRRGEGKSREGQILPWYPICIRVDKDHLDTASSGLIRLGMVGCWEVVCRKGVGEDVGAV